MVTLVCGDKKLETSELQVQSILRIQKQMKRGDWVLPNDSPYEFKDNALIKRTSKEDCRGKKGRKTDSGRGETSGAAPVSLGNDSK